jgi:hypothetical protein
MLYANFLSIFFNKKEDAFLDTLFLIKKRITNPDRVKSLDKYSFGVKQNFL